MTSPQTSLSPAPPASEILWVLGVAVTAGAILGAVDLLLMTTLPYPWAQLADSSAVWAVAAFVLGRALGGGPARAAVAGVVMLVVAVEVYYLAAVAVGLADVATLWSTNTQTWLVFGVIAGVGFGVAGDAARAHGSWAGAAGLALAVGVLLAEAGLRFASLRSAAPWERADVVAVSAATAGLALLVLLTCGRRPAQWVRAGVLAAPLTGLCAVGFVAAGFGI